MVAVGQFSKQGACIYLKDYFRNASKRDVIKKSTSLNHHLFMNSP